MSYSRTDGDYLYDIDINMMAEGIAGNGVISGCAITASGSPDWHTHVAVGVMCVAGTNCIVTAADKTHDTPTSTNVRWDLLEVGTNGTVDIVKGTEVAAGGTPIKPNNSASHIIIAHVYIDGGVGNIPTGNIYDARIMLRPNNVLIRNDKTGANMSNADWTTLYTTSITTSEACAAEILVMVQSQMTAGVGAGYTRVTVDGTQKGSYLLGGTDQGQSLIVPLVAGTDYTKGTAFTLAVQGKSSSASVIVYYQHCTVSAEYE